MCIIETGAFSEVELSPPSELECECYGQPLMRLEGGEGCASQSPSLLAGNDGLTFLITWSKSQRPGPGPSTISADR
jgi:hypothetical protein